MPYCVDIYNERFWEDFCQHGDNSYIGSFIAENEKIDLYLFKDSHHGVEVCMRYGKKDYEYYSPGPLILYLSLFLEDERHRIAKEIILQKCIVESIKIKNF